MFKAATCEHVVERAQRDPNVTKHGTAWPKRGKTQIGIIKYLHNVNLCTPLIDM